MNDTEQTRFRLAAELVGTLRRSPATRARLTPLSEEEPARLVVALPGDTMRSVWDRISLVGGRAHVVYVLDGQTLQSAVVFDWQAEPAGGLAERGRRLHGHLQQFVDQMGREVSAAARRMNETVQAAVGRGETP